MKKSLTFTVKELSGIASHFKQTLEHLTKGNTLFHLKGQMFHDLLVVFTEGVVNAIKHARELENHKKVRCRFLVTNQEIEIRIYDHGPGFRLDRVKKPQFKSFQESGRGIFIMRQLMDEVRYERGRQVNTLILKRFLIGGDQASRDLNLLYEISEAILHEGLNQDSGEPSGHLNPSKIRDVYGVILKKVVDAFEVERASIMMIDKVSKRLKVVASYGFKPKKDLSLRPGEGIAGFVFQHAKPCLIEDMDKNPSGWKKSRKYKSRSFISAPMIAGFSYQTHEAVGVINLTERKNGKPFTKKDLKVLTTIANQATAYLHLCALLGQAREAELFRRDLAIARQIQQSYLPQQLPTLAGAQIASFCQTAQSVGGDYYDVIPADKNRFYMVIADVSGHNIAAAMTMVNVRSRLKALLLQESNPGNLLELLGQSLYQELACNEQFISMIVAELDCKNKKLKLASAGHHFPLLIKRRRAYYLDQVMTNGLVLGIHPHETYATFEVQLKAGDRIILYTDGIVEAINPQGKPLGILGLVRLAEKFSSKKVEETSQEIFSALEVFRQKTPLRDDATLLLVQLS